MLRTVLALLLISATLQAVAVNATQPVAPAANTCNEVAKGLPYFAPWLPWFGPCRLVAVWTNWSWPPTVCYLYQCTFYFGGRTYYYYYRYCRRIWWWRNVWDIKQAVNPELASSARALATADALPADGDFTLVSSSNLADVSAGQKVDLSVGADCKTIDNLATQVANDKTHAQTY